MSYPSEAVDKCRNLYSRGMPHTQIEAEMRKDHATWSRKLLYGESGWIEKFGFEDARRRYQQRRGQFHEAAENATSEMLDELIRMRKQWKKKLTDAGDDPDEQTAYAYLKIVNAIRQLLRDDTSETESINMEDSQLMQILNEIPEIRSAIETHKQEILKAIEQAGAY